MSCMLSRLRVLQLYINVPHWRLTIFFYVIAALLSFATILSYGFVVGWKVFDFPDGANAIGWEWGNLWLESLAFVPPVISMLWAFFTIPYILITTFPLHPGYDIAIHITVFVTNSLPIAFAFSAQGPMHWMVDGANPTSSGTYAGRWEIVGLLGLVLIEFLTFLFLVRAFRQLYCMISGGSQGSRLTRAPTVVGSPFSYPSRDSIWLPSSDMKTTYSQSARTTIVGPVLEPVVDPMMLVYTEKSVDSDMDKTSDVEKAVLSGKPVVTESPLAENDPELPAPLKVRGSAQEKLYKNGNSWEIVDSTKESGQGW